MKKFYAIAGVSLAALTLSLAFGADETPTREIAQPVQNLRTGQEAIANLRQAYEAGNYEEFLASLEADYQLIVKDGSFDEFTKMREDLPEDERLSEITAQWEAQHKALIQERNEKLANACNGQESQLVCKRVLSLISELPSDQKAALDTLSALRFKTPEMAANADEKALIEIDLASEFKMVHLDAQHAAKPVEDRGEKQIVLRMDMMKQMVKASQNFQDEALKASVEKAAQGLDTMQGRIWDLNKLNTIVKKPSSDTEKAIASILSDYRERSQNLYQKEFLAKLDQ